MTYRIEFSAAAARRWAQGGLAIWVDVGIMEA